MKKFQVTIYAGNVMTTFCNSSSVLLVGFFEHGRSVSAEVSCTVLKSLREVKVNQSRSSQRWRDLPPRQRPSAHGRETPELSATIQLGGVGPSPKQSRIVTHPFSSVSCHDGALVRTSLHLRRKRRISHHHMADARGHELYASGMANYFTLRPMRDHHGGNDGQFRTSEILIAHRQMRLLKYCP